MARRKPDPKTDTLRKRGCLHPHPERVSDELFGSNEFFDSRDLLQVKYEMLRRVRVEGHTVSECAKGFGMSRPAFYQAQAAFEEGGLQALFPRKSGPRRAHKLTEEVVEDLLAALANDPDLSSSALVDRINERFGLSVHPRSIERALAREKKKRR